MASGVYSSLRNWASQPFESDMDLTGWFLFGGLIIVIAASWFMILRDLKGAVE